MFYIVRLSVLLVVTIPLALLTIVFGAFDPHGKRVYRINQFWTWLILRLGGVSLRVLGLENLDARQPYIFMANHQSNVDIPVLIQSLNRFQLRWIAKKELLRVPLFGWAMWATKHITVDRTLLLQALQRAAILSNEKFRGVRWMLTGDSLRISCTNNEQEEAQEELEVDYTGDPLDVGFNITYLLDVLTNVSSPRIDCAFGDANSSMLITLPDRSEYRYVVMPMRI